MIVGFNTVVHELKYPADQISRLINNIRDESDKKVYLIQYLKYPIKKPAVVIMLLTRWFYYQFGLYRLVLVLIIKMELNFPDYHSFRSVCVFYNEFLLYPPTDILIFEWLSPLDHHRLY